MCSAYVLINLRVSFQACLRDVYRFSLPVHYDFFYQKLHMATLIKQMMASCIPHGDVITPDTATAKEILQMHNRRQLTVHIM